MLNSEFIRNLRPTFNKIYEFKHVNFLKVWINSKSQNSRKCSLTGVIRNHSIIYVLGVYSIE